MRVTQSTLAFYGYTLGRFLTWLEQQGVTSPADVEARHVRAFLVSVEGKSDSTVNAFARAIRTLLGFWHAENYMPAPVKFAMPRIEQKRLPSLTAEEVSRVLAACNIRDRALILLMVDSGLRRAEACALNWGDLDISSGLVRVARGKGGKRHIRRHGKAR
jgi:integrase